MKIVILGSSKHSPYEFISLPEMIMNTYNTSKGYTIASKKFYSLILECDEIWCYTPIGIGYHTMLDLCFAKRNNKVIRIIGKY